MIISQKGKSVTYNMSIQYNEKCFLLLQYPNKITTAAEHPKKTEYSASVFFTVQSFYTTPSCPSILKSRYAHNVPTLPYLLQRQDRILPDSGHLFVCNTDLPSYDKQAHPDLSVPASASRLFRVSRLYTTMERCVSIHR